MASPTCLICHASIQEEKYKPFCSSRCSLVDLSHWFSGRYTIPGSSLSPSEKELETKEILKEIPLK